MHTIQTICSQVNGAVRSLVCFSALVFYLFYACIKTKVKKRTQCRKKLQMPYCDLVKSLAFNIEKSLILYCYETSVK